MDAFTRLRSSFVAGLFLVLPLAVTLLVLDFAVHRLTVTLATVVSGTGLAELVGNDALATGLAVGTLAVTVTLLGFVASNEAGRRLFGGFERGVRLLAIVRAVYFGVRQVSESLSTPGEGFDRVVVAEFLRDGTWAIGFVTNPAPRGVRRVAGEELMTVFFPHSPNPTAGKLAMMSPEDYEEIDMSVARGLRLPVTTGLSVENPELLPTAVAADGEWPHSEG
ncbi:DUF502 domain-containing protein [Halobaculum gomorrense]|uniref:Uncharacterized membrane protein n=1 Tax=Halobaculum gomorrense TaxID=43928 RepID=A0A1M5JSA5_9EURY|nr:DUF502 domain-containing protein [Halobaculum gomorrense]SHG43398.1 Uncharacterized membrane protein [Halobaculum gomorrense]